VEGDWPFVSIIVPVYNGGLTIDALLTSLTALDYPDGRFEIIVVDNKSTDDSRKRIKKHPVTLVEETQIQSSYAARNRGIDVAKGEILAFTDADCVADPGWLIKLLARSKDPRWGGAAGRIEAYPSDNLVARYCRQSGLLDVSRQHSYFFQDGSGERLYRLVAALDPRRDISLPFNLVNAHTGNVAYRRQVLEQIGCFDAQMSTGGDFDLGWRVQTQTDFEVLIEPDAIVYHQHREDLASFASMIRRYGNAYSALALKYSTEPNTTARQLWIFGSLVTILTVPSHLLKMLTLPFKAIAKRTDSLFWGTPVLSLIASVAYNIGKAEEGWRELHKK
jgi:glycosyltransferase involved in cell wall biosynthesis